MRNLHTLYFNKRRVTHRATRRNQSFPRIRGRQGFALTEGLVTRLLRAMPA